MDVNSVYEWSCRKLNTTIPRNDISDNLLDRVLKFGDNTVFMGKHLRLYSQEFQNLDSLKQWITLLIDFFESIPEPQPLEYEFEGLTFVLPDGNKCKELLSQYAQIKEQLYSL